MKRVSIVLVALACVLAQGCARDVEQESAVLAPASADAPAAPDQAAREGTTAGECEQLALSIHTLQQQKTPEATAEIPRLQKKLEELCG